LVESGLVKNFTAFLVPLLSFASTSGLAHLTKDGNDLSALLSLPRRPSRRTARGGDAFSIVQVESPRRREQPMHRRTLLVVTGALSIGPLASAPARAQEVSNWPTQPLRIVVPYAPGGPTDIPARLLAEELAKVLPQRPVVENRTGAGLVVGTDVVAKATDGHTVLYTTISHAVLRPLFPKLPFDPVADFTPVALVGQIPMVLMVNKNLPVNGLQDLIRLYRDAPGKYDYGSSGNGGALHLASELFLRQAGGLKVTHVPYRGSAAAMPDLLNGTVSMMLGPVGLPRPHGHPK